MCMSLLRCARRRARATSRATAWLVNSISGAMLGPPQLAPAPVPGPGPTPPARPRLPRLPRPPTWPIAEGVAPPGWPMSQGTWGRGGCCQKSAGTGGRGCGAPKVGGSASGAGCAASASSSVVALASSTTGGGTGAAGMPLLPPLSMLGERAAFFARASMAPTSLRWRSRAESAAHVRALAFTDICGGCRGWRTALACSGEACMLPCA